MRTFRLLPALSSFAMFSVFAVLLGGIAHAAAPCADDGGAFPRNCTKEIRIWNNTPRKIYVVLQVGKKLQLALNCTVKAKGGGDVWLQAAFGDSTKCYKVKNDYSVYINPDTGIPPDSFVSIQVPWWSKRLQSAPDLYIDWWRGARVVIFDDQTALNESYLRLKRATKFLVKFAAGSPQVRCTPNKPNDRCKQREVQVFQVPPTLQIGQQTPLQLNEFTFASVDEVSADGKTGGKLLNLNQNYNVSNVDQLYLPIAIEPVRAPANVPYMGTTMPVKKLRETLQKFTGKDGMKWPIYNNPVKGGHHKYPTAGIRVPSALAAFNYYMNPSFFPSGEPEIIPAHPPALLQRMMDQWQICISGSAPCPDKKVYQEINDVFLDNYRVYYDKGCYKQPNAPPFLNPLPNSAPPRPKLTAFLRYIHGWVPFNDKCNVPELPTVAGGSRAPIDYINLQYNYLRRPAGRWFNPYTHLVHAPLSEGGLDANAYAFSIDDQSSFLTNDGGSLPGGLIIAVGGAKGLVNGKKMPPPVPPYYAKFFFEIALGAPEAGGAVWAKYGICSDTAATPFPPSSGGYSIGIDPGVQRISAGNPCKITLTDSKNKKYQIVVKQARVSVPIWPTYLNPQGFDPNVVSCSAGSGFVPPNQWCNFTNEIATLNDPKTNEPKYSLIARGPLK